MNLISWKGIDTNTKLFINYIRRFNHPMKVRLFRELVKKIYPQGITVKNQLGSKIYVQCDQYIGWEILCTGSYEGNTLALAAEIMKDGGIFLDQMRKQATI